MHAHFNNLYFFYDPFVCRFVSIPNNGVLMHRHKQKLASFFYKSLSRQMTPHTTPLRTSLGLCSFSILYKIGRAITKPDEPFIRYIWAPCKQTTRLATSAQQMTLLAVVTTDYCIQHRLEICNDHHHRGVAMPYHRVGHLKRRQNYQIFIECCILDNTWYIYIYITLWVTWYDPPDIPPGVSGGGGRWIRCWPTTAFHINIGG